MPEVWLHAFAFPRRVAELARQAEAWGFTGLLLADSQNLTADIWVELALAAAATERLRLGPGVTNPLTRHPAVTAAAAATLQAESGGRAVLGLARGDSALSKVGLRPLGPAAFERALQQMQGFLAGEEVALADGGRSRIAWIAASPAPKVPVHVAATGPRVIAAAARHADAVDFTVGAEPERLAWAVATARAESGSVSLGAFVNVAVHPDPAVARDLVRGSTSTLARFGAEGAPPDGLSAETRAGIARLAAEYDAAQHGQAAGAAARRMDDAFVDRFAVCGPADAVAARLRELAALGLSRLVIVPCSLDTEPAAMRAANERFAAEVLPALAAA
jgi:5,10-methylenetetrahydromethanopterin reductase